MGSEDGRPKSGVRSRKTKGQQRKANGPTFAETFAKATASNESFGGQRKGERRKANTN
jgi:hypothetical protein